MVNDYGEPEVDENFQPIRVKGVLETFPFEKIEKTRKDIEFIMDNKDKI